jgi:aspartyl protease family protein
MLPAQPWDRLLRRTLAVLAWVAGVAGPAMGQGVSLAGVMGAKALLLVDGGAPKLMGVGDTHAGVKLLGVQGDQVAVAIDGKTQHLRLGESPANVGGNGGSATQGSRISLAAGSGGHFFTAGQINGKAIQFLVDTGATSVALSLDDAKRIGLDWQNAQPVRVGTANGTAMGWRLKLSSLRIGDVEVYEVDAVVTTGAMPYALLGNSFLTRFQMNRTNDQLVLVKRY